MSLKLCRECLKYSMGVFESMETRIDNIATYLDNFDERLTDVHQRSVRIENTLDEVQEGSVR